VKVEDMLPIIRAIAERDPGDGGWLIWDDLDGPPITEEQHAMIERWYDQEMEWRRNFVGVIRLALLSRWVYG
jgi:hypothetical protein